MLAVWSFWTKPFEDHYHKAWLSPKHHLFSWVLSVETARKHYERTALFTDDAGAQLLVDQLGLQFDSVSTDLNVLADHDPGWWALGKLHAYSFQREPFIHIDSDAYLWKRLPDKVTSSAVFAQNPEYFGTRESYWPERLESALSDGGSVWLPAEWVWYRAVGGIQRGEACGVFGGQHVDFITHYARQAIRMIEHPENRAGWALLDTAKQNTLCEQYLLAACIEYHRRHDHSPYQGIEIRYLFESEMAAYEPGRAEQLGYTHIVADSKHDREIAAQLERRVKRDYPDHYRRCVSKMAGDRKVETKTNRRTASV